MLLSPRVNQDSHNIQLKAVGGEPKGFVVVRNLGVVDAMEAFLYKLKPDGSLDTASTGAPQETYPHDDILGLVLSPLARPTPDATA